MKIIIVSAVTAAVVSGICCKISAVHTFNVIDGYVKEFVEIAKRSIWNARSDK